MRERHAEVVGEGLGAGLVELADGEQAVGGVDVGAKADVDGGEDVAEAGEGGVGEACGLDDVEHGELIDLDLEDVAEIDDGVAGHGEGELGLAGGRAFDGGDEEGADVEDGGEGGEPALVVMLGAVVAEDGVGDVRLEDVGGPALPLDEQGDERGVAAIKAVAAEEFGGGGGRAGAGVEQGDRDLAAAEGGVEDGDVADDEGDEAEAGAALKDHEEAGHLAAGNDVAGAERGKGGAADVDIRKEAEAGMMAGREAGVHIGGAEAVEHEGEAEGEQAGPEEEQKDQRDRAVDAVELLAKLMAADVLADVDPRLPGEDEEEAGDAEAAGGAAGDDDGLHGVERDQAAEEQTERNGEPMHERVLLPESIQCLVRPKQ